MPNLLADGNELLRFLARDLCILTYDEMQTAWGQEMRDAAVKVSEKTWAELVPLTHNPIYYIAEHIVFANVKHDTEFLYAPTHRDIVCKELLEYYLQPEGVEKAGLMLLMQRYSFKSTFMHLVMPLFILIRDKRLLDRETRILLVHYKQLQASLNLGRLKTTLATDAFLQWTYPEFCLGSSEEGKQDAFFMPGVSPKNDPMPSVVAIGLTGDVTGLHAHHVFFSDLVTEEARTSKTIRSQIEAKHESILFILPAGRRKCWYDGTLYHIHDLWHKMMNANIEGKKLYRIVFLPAWNAETDYYSLPIRHSKARLDFMRQEEISRTGNDFMFCLQMLLQAKSTRFIAGDRRWYRFCKRAEVPMSAWFAILCDGAWKGTHNAGMGDFASIQVWAFEVRGAHVFGYLMDGAHSNEYTSFDGEREIMRLMQKWDVVDVAVEEHGGAAFRTGLAAAADKRGLFINIIDLKMKTVQKQGRMSAFLKDVQAGLIFICDEVPEELKEPLLEQTDEFPQCIDEMCDALDAAAYSRDPNVVDQYMPAARARQQGRGRRVDLTPPERRTRHCAN
jgi:hypothetical protein